MNAQEHASHQLARMRAMVGMYHRMFFRDVRFTLLFVVGLLGLGWWGIGELFLVVPFVCLWGATQTAFDASYLIMGRHYAAALEAYLNEKGADGVLVGSALEDAYLFPLNSSKVVTVPTRGPFTWFSFMTMFLAAGGLWMGVAGLWAGWDTLFGLGGVARVAYLVALGVFTSSAFGAGLWWFVGGVGERRLTAILEQRFSGRAAG